MGREAAPHLTRLRTQAGLPHETWQGYRRVTLGCGGKGARGNAKPGALRTSVTHLLNGGGSKTLHHKRKLFELLLRARPGLGVGDVALEL